MNYLKWIESESDEWVQDGIITEEQQNGILSRYNTPKAGNPLLALFAVIGTLLIGTGVIMVFATNWHGMTIPTRLAVAFLPLIIAMGACAFTALNRYSSAAFREGSATLLSLSVFATVALVGQTFHTATDMSEYLLMCGLLSLPAAYLFRSKTVLTIFTVCALYAGDTWIAAILLCALPLPLFYLELKQSRHRGIIGLHSLLLSALAALLVFRLISEDALYFFLSVGVTLLLLDIAIIKISAVRFYTPSKILGFSCIAGTIGVAAFDFSASRNFAWALVVVLILCFGYYVCRRIKAKTWEIPTGTDALVISAILLALSMQVLGVMANILLLALGVFFIVLGTKSMRMSHVNFGMSSLILLIALRFFDSNISLLARGIVFILLGIAFLAVNVIMSKKRKEIQL
jgi:uncharacterized membrane protein